MADKIDETYDPSTVEVDRGREQGLGMGEKDLKRQPRVTSPADLAVTDRAYVHVYEVRRRVVAHAAAADG